MTDITIPPEAVEVAAINVATLLDWPDWASMDEEDHALCRRIATAALRAGIAAWPGMWHIKAVDFEGKVILPLPQEARDE